MLTIASIVKNEADRYLPKALECWTELADRVVVIDNGSTDGTQDLLGLAGVEWSSFTTPMDGAEWVCRKALWDWAVPGSDWIVHLDADQCVAGDFRPFLTGKRAAFPVFDLWSPTQYRSDAWWRGHARAWWPAINVSDHQTHDWSWNQRAWHSGHTPDTSFLGPIAAIPAECGILHYAYATEEGRRQHSARYAARSGVLTASERFHASTILDERPRLLDLPFRPRWSLI